jgi:hypothetical protein
MCSRQIPRDRHCNYGRTDSCAYVALGVCYSELILPFLGRVCIAAMALFVYAR